MINSDHVLRIATSSIGNSKLRSTLTILGIMIGVAAVVANVSIGSSFSQYFTDEISSVGSNFIIAYSKQPNLFFENELDLIKNTPGIIGISPQKSTSGELIYLFETRSVDVTGVEEELEKIQDIKMDEGTFIRNKETYVAVLGYDIANKEFGRKISHRNSVNITFRQNDGTVIEKTFKVNGIIQKSKPSVLSNSGILSLLGGILGTTIGGLGAYALESLLKLPPVFPSRLIVVRSSDIDNSWSFSWDLSS